MEDNQITDNDKEDDKQDRIELVQRAVEGDKEAFTNLYTLTYSEVYHIVKVFIHNEDTAQDIVQEKVMNVNGNGFFSCFIFDAGYDILSAIVSTFAESGLGFILGGRR